MANRYWVGNTAAWDGTAGTKWALTSGGAGGQAVPTSADDVFFSNLSTGTCTISTGNTGAKSITCTGFTGTLTGTAAITVSGSITLVAGMTFTYSGTVTINGTGTLTTAGKTLSRLTINGAGITVTLGDNLNCNNEITHTAGTFTTSANNFSITAGALVSTNSNTRTISLNGSTVSVSLSNSVDFTTSTNLTFNAGTSQINVSAPNTTFAGGNQTFYNVSFTGTTAVTHNITGANTFNNLSVTAPSVAGVTQVTFNSNTIINGTLSTTGTAGNRRVWFRSATYGLTYSLTVNSAPSLTDADFRDLQVIGTASPISGTRIGDLRGNTGITFSAPKTVYWNLAGAQNWSATGWATTSTGTPSTDNFPLAQDTATFTNAGSVTGTITMNTAIPYTGTVDMSGRTSAMTLAIGAYSIYGNWTNGSGTTLTGTSVFTFSGRNTQTITSAGKTFSNSIIVDTYGGIVEFADAFANGNNSLNINNGTFDTKGYTVNTGTFSSTNSNVRTFNLGASTFTISGTQFDVTNSTNLTFNAGTSQITCTAASAITFAGGGKTFYNVSFTGTTAVTHVITGANTFNNLTFTAPAATGLMQCTFSANQTITGTLTCAGASAIRRIFLRSDTLGTQRDLTVGTLVATDCDFRDIDILGTAAGSSPTRAGDCGGNAGITFPAPKTVYWNLAGAQNWSATGWAPGSAGTPDINQFPLAQDTAVFDNAGSVTGTITVNAAWNIGTVNMSGRTSAMTLSGSSTPSVYGNWLNGTGTTIGGGQTLNFSGRTTQTITSNGVSFGSNLVQINSPTGTVQLADAFQATTGVSLVLGTFDAVSYNVTCDSFINSSTVAIFKMGSGTWTLTGTGTVWGLTSAPILYKGTANIVLSNTTTTARTFAGGSLSYNKLTIGGTTGISTLTLSGNNQFTELASTKTVAHTIDLGATTQTFGKWTVTGTAGNVVTLTGTGVSHILAGAATSGIDYLAMGSIGFAATSPAEFYAGANSTGTAAAPVYRTAKPADSTRYWVGGTGNWSDTARWSTGSGGAGGASVPRSHDDVVFDSLSNATAYTATVNAVTGGIRCKALTIAGPLVGDVTLAGSTAIVGIHGNVTLPATGLTRTYTGLITLSGAASYTLTTNGVTLAANTTVNGVGTTWTLGSALNIGTGSLTVTNGTFTTGNFTVTSNNFNSSNSNSRTINLGSSTVTLTGNTEFSNSTNLTFNAGTSTISSSSVNAALYGGGQTFYNVSFTSTVLSTPSIEGVNTFNNLTVAGRTSAGIANISLFANQTINGTLTLSAGTDATMRTFVRSNTLGTTRTLTCAAVSATDVDFRDITITGAAAPVSGTRLGDCKGNSGITFGAGVTRYWNLAAGGNWSATGWAASSGASPSVNNFPLAQDTCVFEATGLNSGATVAINFNYHIGTINMSARTTNTMTLASLGNDFLVYGNWINGTGTTLTGSGAMTFAGRGSQTITSAGRTFTQPFIINSPGGSVTLQDAFVCSVNNIEAFNIPFGTFDAATYNFTLSGAISGVLSTTSNTKTIAVGSGTWTIAGTNGWNLATSTNTTITGTGTINLTAASAKTFAGGSLNYSGITLNQGGVGTLTITGNNTFANITDTVGAATTIALGATTQRVGNFTASGSAGNLLTITGTSAASPATIIYTGAGTVVHDYIVPTFVRVYPLTSTWEARNSTNGGSLGYTFTQFIPPAAAYGNFFFLFG